jgi:hypothetical protein
LQRPGTKLSTALLAAISLLEQEDLHWRRQNSSSNLRSLFLHEHRGQDISKVSTVPPFLHQTATALCIRYCCKALAWNPKPSGGKILVQMLKDACRMFQNTKSYKSQIMATIFIIIIGKTAPFLALDFLRRFTPWRADVKVTVQRLLQAQLTFQI